MNFRSFLNLILFFSIAIFGSCTDNAEPTLLSQDLKGTYNGTFQRFSGEKAGEISLIEMTFDNGTWGGTSSIQKYPALCAGKYTIINGEIIFTNECFWTAEFDWSLILSGTFKVQRTQTKMTFEKTMGSGENKIRDVYNFPITLKTNY